jgi:hypothetical protein
MHYLLFYTVADDYLARRAAFRKEHLAHAWRAAEKGDLVLGGALANPPDAAILLFQGASSRRGRGVRAGGSLREERRGRLLAGPRMDYGRGEGGGKSRSS